MANQEHLAQLLQGSAIWNGWRARNLGIKPDLIEANLNGADLREADLYEADLREANLNGANLCGASLCGANLSATKLSTAKLSKADLTFANLAWAVLSGAVLSAADLGWAVLTEADLDGADLNDVVLYETNFGNVDLSKTIGLDNCEHQGPSILDLRTLLSSGDLPLSFLRGCGLPDLAIDYLPSLHGEALSFYSCFISYSAKDLVFAERLHAGLQNKRVRCWFAPHDLAWGVKTRDAINEAIRRRDKLLVILSEASIASDWVEDEVNRAYAEERERKETVLFPIRIDDAVMTTSEPWAQKLRDQLNIGDFRMWKKPVEYQKSLKRLLRDLKGSGTK